MGLQREEHEIYKRRAGRNFAVLAILLAFVAMMFAVTVVKVSDGDLLEGYDHSFRASELPLIEEN